MIPCTFHCDMPMNGLVPEKRSSRNANISNNNNNIQLKTVIQYNGTLVQ